SVARRNSPGLRLCPSQRITPNLVSSPEIYAGLSVPSLVSAFSPLYTNRRRAAHHFSDWLLEFNRISVKEECRAKSRT
ncbi:hypothetical protein CDAR_251441, partial [Caerostris darwini]